MGGLLHYLLLKNDCNVEGIKRLRFSVSSLFKIYTESNHYNFTTISIIVTISYCMISACKNLTNYANFAISFPSYCNF